MSDQSVIMDHLAQHIDAGRYVRVCLCHASVAQTPSAHVPQTTLALQQSSTKSLHHLLTENMLWSGCVLKSALT